MTSDSCHPDLDHALQLAGQMMEAATAGDWSRVATLQTKCDALVRRAYPHSDATHKALLALQSQHEQLSARVAQARDGIAQEIARHTHNHRALNAYLDSSPTP